MFHESSRPQKNKPKGIFRKTLEAAVLATALSGSNCAPPIEGQCEIVEIEDFGDVDSLKLPELSETEIEKIKPYLEILRYPNMQPVVDQLAGIQIVDSDKKERTGYEMLIQLLAKGYFDQNIDFIVLRETINSYFKYADRETSIFILQVAQSLWVEHNGITPWSLKDYSESDIASLFFNHYLDGNYFLCRSAMDTEEVSTIQKPNKGKWNPKIPYLEPQVEMDASYQLHHIAEEMIMDDHKETIKQIVRFIKSNFMHTYVGRDREERGFELYRDERPDSEQKGFITSSSRYFIPRNLSRYFEERIGGCNEPAMLAKWLARSLNIPAIDVRIKGHGGTYFPTIGLFVHGDVLTGKGLCPSEALLFTVEDSTGLEEGGMMGEVVERKLKTVYAGEGDPDPERTRFNLNMNALAFCLDSYEDGQDRLCMPEFQDIPYPPSIEPLFQQEIPQFHPKIVLDEHGETVLNTDQLYVRSLEDFADNGKIWE